ncbi:unnamed protein product [Cylindrotheca closterium]|uniref:Uncharacterized protein n=1 Tax=Cylindrotheca closterium TaxID=2856 RepID=A0AAD2FJU3_9STRA|nr:unnamed protein product [Cylindrotheca closterium]
MRQITIPPCSQNFARMLMSSPKGLTNFDTTTSTDKATPLQRKLSYLELTIQDSGTLVHKRRNEIFVKNLDSVWNAAKDYQRSYTCANEYIKSILDETGALFVTGECAGGVCFACYPKRDPSLLSPERRRYSLSIKSPSFRR